jgi:CRP-like cAMP-binding protein
MKRRDIETGEASRMAETLRQRGALAGLGADTIAAVVRRGALVELEPGEVLIREGAAAAEVYLLLEGTLVVQSQSGTVARLEHPGDVAGEAAVLLSQKRTADVVAETAVRAIEIPSKLLAQPEFSEVAVSIRAAMLRDDWVQY